jgi:hypothetical protein
MMNMKFPPNRICPRVFLNDKLFARAEHWGRETSKRSVELLRKRGEHPTTKKIRSDQSNHDLSVKGEFAFDYYLNGTVENAEENSRKFCEGNSHTPLIPDNVLPGLFDYETGVEIRPKLGVEVKSTRRKDYPEKLKLPVKEKQFREYQSAKEKGVFDAFVYVLTVTVRDHPNAVCLVGFAREDEILKSIVPSNRNSHGDYTIHFCQLHPIENLRSELFTEKRIQDVWAFC